MMISEIQLLYVLHGATALLVAAAGIAIVRFQKKFRDSAAFWASPTGTFIHAEAHGGESNDAIAVQLAELRQLLESLAARDRSSPSVVSGESRFGNAVKLAKQGVTPGELTKHCGLNIGEAQLLIRLHGPRSVVSDAA